MKYGKPKKDAKKKYEYSNTIQLDVKEVLKIPLSVSPWSIYFAKF